MNAMIALVFAYQESKLLGAGFNDYISKALMDLRPQAFSIMGV
jgi:hypothetical protein